MATAPAAAAPKTAPKSAPPKMPVHKMPVKEPWCSATELRASEKMIDHITESAKRGAGRGVGAADIKLIFKVAHQVGIVGAELAIRTGLDSRYVREWLGGMAAGGYVTYTPADSRFKLPAEHAAVLADEGGLFFAGGALQLTLAKLPQISRVEEAFRMGGGVPESAFGDDLWAGNPPAR